MIIFKKNNYVIIYRISIFQEQGKAMKAKNCKEKNRNKNQNKRNKNQNKNRRRNLGNHLKEEKRVCAI
jgi:hypothetical protein